MDISKELKLKKEIRDLKMYVYFLECKVHDGSDDVIEWTDVEDMIFTKPIYTSKSDPDKMSEFQFINTIE